MRSAKFVSAGMAALLWALNSPADAVVWPLPECSAPELASASPAPAASDSSSLKALPFVMRAWPMSAAFVVGLDEANRPVLRCVVSGRSNWDLIATASEGAAGLVLSTPLARNSVVAEGRYLLRVSTNFGFTWVSPPPPYPLLPDCTAAMRARGAPPPSAVPQAPKPAQRVNPKYPVAALQEEMEGQVIVFVDVFSNGAASAICIEGGAPPGWFEQAAVDAIGRWRFQPRDGMAVYRVTVKFRLE